MLKPHYSEKFKKQFKKLPKRHQNKFLKQLELLFQNPLHPSLHKRKQTGSESFEARVDYHYRFTFVETTNEIVFLTIGPHDEGLGKK